MNWYPKNARAISNPLKVAFGFLLYGVVQAEEPKPSDGETYSVAWIGKMMTVHRDGDASPQTDLAKPAHRPGGFAIGPIAGLRGEITVLDDVAYVSRVIDGAEEVVHSWDFEAPFLVYGHVDKWAEAAMPESVQSTADLEQWLPQAAEKLGLDTSKPFPFKVECSNAAINYHIISNEVSGYKTTRPHSELMKHFELNNKEASLLGVYSTEHAGVFTHHGSATHIHVISKKGNQSGHVDAVKFNEGAKLFLPAR